MYNVIKDLDLCINEKERRIVKRLDKLSEEDLIYWQNFGSQIPILIIIFIGSTIIRNNWVIKILIIGYIIYGYRVQYDYNYYFRVIYPRFKGNKK